MEGPVKKSCVTRKESQKLGVSLSTKGVWRRGPSCIIPDPRISCSIYCSQKSTSSPTEVTPWIVWPPAGCQFSPQCDLCVGPSFPSKQDRKFKEIMRPVSSCENWGSCFTLPPVSSRSRNHEAGLSSYDPALSYSPGILTTTVWGHGTLQLPFPHVSLSLYFPREGTPTSLCTQAWHLGPPAGNP